jgi:uncharacterized protein YjiS (DUF1127 family)
MGRSAKFGRHLIRMRSSYMTVIPWHAHETGCRRVGRPSRGYLARVLAAVRERHRRARNRHELEALDERTLHDLGLSRSDITYLSRSAGDNDRWLDSLRYPPC